LGKVCYPEFYFFVFSYNRTTSTANKIAMTTRIRIIVGESSMFIEVDAVEEIEVFGTIIDYVSLQPLISPVYDGGMYSP